MSLNGEARERGAPSEWWVYLCLLIPTLLWAGSLYFPPIIFTDSGVGFLALRNMFAGGSFNTILVADPSNIAHESEIFLTFSSPGQYLVPGAFVWAGASYGVAISLTAIIVTFIGLVGWIQLARRLGASRFVLLTFALGLSSFTYVTLPFRMYHGGELLLFGVAPWCLYATWWALKKPFTVCFVALLSIAAVLFFAKLTGLVVFAANVISITLVTLIKYRRLNAPLIAMWLAAIIAAIFFTALWSTRGPVPADTTGFFFNWNLVWFSVAAATFSGLSALSFLTWLLTHPSIGAIPNYFSTIELSYVLAGLGLLLVVWSWLELRNTQYRDMAETLLTIVFVYSLILLILYFQGSNISIAPRHFRYPGILFFLLLLTAIDQSRRVIPRGAAIVVVAALGLYGLKSALTDFRSMRVGNYDAISGISQDITPVTVLEMLRTETSREKIESPVVIVPSPAAMLSLPGFRLIDPFGAWTGYPNDIEWAGKAEKVFVILPERLRQNGKSEAILRRLVDYKLRNWTLRTRDGMLIYSQ